MKIEVYDLECLSNLFTYTGYDYQDKTWYQFVIHSSRNDINKLYNHLYREKLIMVGFNNESYDYPLLHHLLNHYNKYQFLHPQDVAISLYKKSQEIIDMEFSTIADRNKYIQQLDLFKIWHYNNAARSTSLKDLEIQLRMENIEEMPIHHTKWCDESDIPIILSYNKNDVDATRQFLDVTIGRTNNPLYKGKNKIKLRLDLQKQFGVNCLNLPDVKIGETLMLNLYARAVNRPIFEIKQLRTPREQISLKECIPDWCKVESVEFNDLINSFKSTTIKGNKGEFAKSIIYHGIKIDFGTGGSHASCEPGVYKSDDQNIILDLDVSSLYPSIAKSLNLYPEHLGPEFVKLYSQFIDKRIAEKHKPKNERNDVLIEGFKLILNGTKTYI